MFCTGRTHPFLRHLRDGCFCWNASAACSRLVFEVVTVKARQSENGFTLLEVMIGTVILVILALGLAGSMGAAFMADATARDTAAATHAGQQVMEELQKLDYLDVLGCDGNAIVTSEDIAIKVSATETMVGMILVEVRACRLLEKRTVLELAGLTMGQFASLRPATGAQVRLMTYRAAR